MLISQTTGANGATYAAEAETGEVNPFTLYVQEGHDRRLPIKLDHFRAFVVDLYFIDLANSCTKAVEKIDILSDPESPCNYRPLSKYIRRQIFPRLQSSNPKLGGFEGAYLLFKTRVSKVNEESGRTAV